MAGGARPIEIDRASLLELARGGNLYADRFACVRELLQNAADATLLRLFEERGAASFPTHERSIADLRASLATRPIDVHVEPIGSDVAAGAIRIRLRDLGTGISRADAEFLGTLGASWRNPHRRALIEAMPEWMRPSGTFGIGLHSVFLVTEEVRLRSTHAASGESLAIRMFRDADGVSIELGDAEPLEGGGTEVEIDVPREREPPDSNWTSADPAGVAAFWADPFFDPTPDWHLVAARGLVRATAPGSVVPVRLGGEDLPRAFDGGGAIFDPEAGIELGWIDDEEYCARGWGPINYAPQETPTRFYRGAPVRGPGGYDPPLLVNAHFGTARELLAISRDKLSRVGAQRLEDLTSKTFLRVAWRWLAATGVEAVPERLRPWLSRALWRRHCAVDDAWRAAVVGRDADDREVSLGAIASAGAAWVVSGDKHPRAASVRFGTPTRALSAAPGVPVADLERMFGGLRIERLEFVSGEALGASGSHASRTLRAGAGARGITDAAFRAKLRAPDEFRNTVREWLPCHDRYGRFGLDLDAIRGAFGDERVADRFGPSYLGPQMLSPFFAGETALRVPYPDRWTRFCAEYAIGGPCDPKALAPLVWRFLVDFDADVRAAPGFEHRYELDALRMELVAAFGEPLPSVAEVRALLAAEPPPSLV